MKIGEGNMIEDKEVIGKKCKIGRKRYIEKGV